MPESPHDSPVFLKSVLVNRLTEEKSPYLLQHAHNPVHWQPWDEAAFALAREYMRPCAARWKNTAGNTMTSGAVSARPRNFPPPTTFPCSYVCPAVSPIPGRRRWFRTPCVPSGTGAFTTR
jgi:hypothetical protein